MRKQQMRRRRPSGTNGTTAAAADDPVLRLAATRDGTAFVSAFMAINTEMRAAIVRLVVQIAQRQP